MASSLTSSTVADFLLYESRERGELLTNLKLQKLLYYSQAWYLAIYNTPLFDEDFEAWIHGPVEPSQYHRFSRFRWQNITDDIVRPCFEKQVSDHLLEILDVFGSESAVALELMTHQEAPWIDARGDLPAEYSSKNIISKDSMGHFYKKMADVSK